MSNVTPLHSEHSNPFVAHAADEIRGIMAAKRIPGYKLPALTNTATSRGYWQRRLNGEVAFDLDNLSALAMAFDMPLASLLARLTSDYAGNPTPHNAKKTPTPKSEGLVVGPAGIEPTTSTVEYRHLAEILPFTRSA